MHGGGNQSTTEPRGNANTPAHNCPESTIRPHTAAVRPSLICRERSVAEPEVEADEAQGDADSEPLEIPGNT